MPGVGSDIAVGGLAAVPGEGIHHFLGHVGGEQPVRRKRNDQGGRLDTGQGCIQRGVSGGNIEVVHGLGDIQVGIGVEAVHKSLTLVVKIGFHVELALEMIPQLVAVAQRAPELAVHGLVGKIGDMGQHTGNGKSLAWPGTIPVGATLECRIRLNGVAADSVKRDLLGTIGMAGGDKDDGTCRVRIAGRPFQGLHAAQGTADHTKQAPNAELADQGILHTHHVAHRDDREIQAVGRARFGIDAGGTGRSLAAAQEIGTDDEVPGGVNALSGPDHNIPPAGLGFRQVRISGGVGVAGQGMAYKHRVGARFV
ncbi:MAG: hypothetical protein BWX80_01425 [Candidatus Hydrogenedentes bacterium ADurb.Bin101]|nr:MAG: hypothetical protein BWX80_01425 [Candidatus Hydrogenedentes bacterium ADurb.Bin101]